MNSHQQDRRDRTPLHLTAESGKPDAVKTLVRLGGDTESLDSQGLTPLHAAIRADAGNMVRSFIDAGVDRNHKDPIGRSYAEYALLSRKMDAFRALVK